MRDGSGKSFSLVMSLPPVGPNDFYPSEAGHRGSIDRTDRFELLNDTGVALSRVRPWNLGGVLSHFSFPRACRNIHVPRDSGNTCG